MTSERFLTVSYKAIISLLTVSLMTACNNTAQSALETSPKESAFSSEEITTTSIQTTKTEAAAPEITEPPAETGISVTVEGDSREFTLIGTPHSESEFGDFNLDGFYDQIYEEYATDSRWDNASGTMITENNPYREKNDAMFDSLGVPEIKELYLKASELWFFFKGGDTMLIAFSAFSPEDSARLLTQDTGTVGQTFTYYETGVSSEDFFNAVYEVYTEEAVKEMLKNSPFYVFYNGEVWVTLITSSSVNLVGTELELTKQTDTEIEFQSILYQGITTHTPHNGEVENPEVYKFNNKFVKTEKGWRVVEIATVRGYVS